MESFELTDVSSIAGTAADGPSQRTSVLLLSPTETNRSGPGTTEHIVQEQTPVDSSRYESSLGRVDGGFQAWSLVRLPWPSFIGRCGLMFDRCAFMCLLLARFCLSCGNSHMGLSGLVWSYIGRIPSRPEVHDTRPCNHAIAVDRKPLHRYHVYFR